MRFVLLIFVIVGALFGTNLNYFAGAGITFSSPTLQIEARGKNGSKQELEMNSKSYVLSLNGGVQQYWDREEYVGGRAMGEFGIGGASVDSGIAGVFSLSGALDLLVDFLKQDSVNLGIFGGFEYGMTFLVSGTRVNGYAIKSETYSAYWRVGASVTFERIHRLDLTYKAPISPLALPTEVLAEETRHQVYSGGQFSLGYKLLF
ncbi:outer membrane beta-barrel protein [Helicobacter pametensis]|uniref:outer membrane beta-barrel protein n=1 Tax=Helicobacter pametensis TaxID=95149 RepID=UPI0004896DA8|nr:outer membrane beta-barrel protein [Helicobacter pametensis]